MAKIYLINEMDFQIPAIEGYMTGTEDYPLTELGILRARITGTQLKTMPFSLVLTSPLLRCRQAAEEIFDTVETLPELTDADLGDWQGLGLDEIQQRWPEEYQKWLFDPMVLPPRAEPFKDRAERLEAVLSSVLSRSSGDLAVFTHSRLIVPFLASLQSLPEDKWNAVQIPYGGVSILEWDGSQFEILQSGEQIIPDMSEALETLILDYYHVAEPERLRCRSVAEKSRQLAEKISETGLLLDPDIVYDAAILQSIGGTDQEGAESGSRILDTMGYSDIAYAVLNHVDVFFRSIINEGVLLYLTNRMFPEQTEQTFAEVFKHDRSVPDENTENRIAQDIVIINMINTLCGEEIIPL